MRACARLLLVALSVFPGAAVGATLSVPDTTVVSPGEVFEVPVTMESATGVLGYFFTLRYSDGFAFVDAGQGTLTQAWSQQVAYEGTNQVSIAGSGSVAVNGTGAIAVMRLQALPETQNGHACDLAFEAAELNDGAIPVSARDGRLLVSTVIVLTQPAILEVAPGESFALPLIAHEAVDVYGYYIDMTYDSGVLQYDGWTQGALPCCAASQPWPGPSVNLQPGRIRAAESGNYAAAGTGSLIVLNFTALGSAPYDTEVAIGVDAELNDGALAVTASPGMVRVVDPLTVWVDFGAAPGGDGTEGAPCNTLAEAVARVAPGHTVRTKPGFSTDRPRITKALRLVADGGLVRIGVPVAGGTLAALTGTRQQLEVPGTGLANSPTRAAKPVSASVGSSTSGSPFREPPGNHDEGALPWSVLPFTTDENGVICLGAEREVSLLLRGEAAIDTDTLTAIVIGMPPKAYAASWSHCAGSSLHGVWVHVALREGYEPRENFLVIATAQLLNGQSIGLVAREFSPECDAAAAYRLHPVPQPEGSMLHVYAVPPELLPAGTPPREHVYYIAPERVYDTPESAWLPVPGEGDWMLEYLVPFVDGAVWFGAQDTSAPFALGEAPALVQVQGAYHIQCFVKHGAMVGLREIHGVSP